MQPIIINIKKDITGTPSWLADVKQHIAILDGAHDTELTALIRQAAEAVGNYCNISINNHTITLIADICSHWELPYPPVNEVTSVKYTVGYSETGVPIYADDEGWAFEGGMFIPQVGLFSPGVPFMGYFNDSVSGWMKRYRIVYKTGYDTVPDDLKLSVLNEVAYRFENKGDTGGICEAARVLANPYKRVVWV